MTTSFVAGWRPARVTILTERPLINPERHAFDNLLLLCGPHHKEVDDHPDTYTVAKLHEMIDFLSTSPSALLEAPLLHTSSQSRFWCSAAVGH